MTGTFLRALHDPCFETWNHMKEMLVHIVLPLVPYTCYISEYLETSKSMTYSCSNVVSGFSSSSAVRNSPFVIKALIEHKAWTVRPKCLPWWTRGSVPPHLVIWMRKMIDWYWDIQVSQAHGFFLGPSCKAPWRFLPMMLCSSSSDI